MTRRLRRTLALTAVVLLPMAAVTPIAPAQSTPSPVILNCGVHVCTVNLAGTTHPQLQVRYSNGGGGLTWLSSLIAALSALLGVLGGWLVARYTSRAQRTEEQRQNQLRRRGILGLIADDLHRWEGTVVEAYYRNKWWRKDALLPPRSDAEALRRAVTALPPPDWRSLSSAWRWIDLLTVEADHDKKPDSERARWLAETFYRLEVARWGVEKRVEALAEDEPRDGDPAQTNRWRSYNHEALRERYRPDVPARADDYRLTRLEEYQLKELARHGVSAYLETQDGKKLLPARFRSEANQDGSRRLAPPAGQRDS